MYNGRLESDKPLLAIAEVPSIPLRPLPYRSNSEVLVLGEVKSTPCPTKMSRLGWIPAVEQAQHQQSPEFPARLTKKTCGED
jgi:hypothetical protein